MSLEALAKVMRRRHRRYMAAHLIKVGSLTNLKAGDATNHRRMISWRVCLSLLALVELLHHRHVVYARLLLHQSHRHAVYL